MAGVMRLVFCATLCAALMSGPVLAQSVDTSRGDRALAAIVAPVVGRKACFSRTYDRAHLRQHPKQQVTEMTFELRYVRVPVAEIQRYVFGISAKLRTRSDALYASGWCETNVTETFPAGNLCVVACDGGGVSIEKIANADAIYLHLATPADGIAMRLSCGEGTEGAGVWLSPGADDKLFRLDRVPGMMCRFLEQAADLGKAQ